MSPFSFLYYSSLVKPLGGASPENEISGFRAVAFFYLCSFSKFMSLDTSTKAASELPASLPREMFFIISLWEREP